MILINSRLQSITHSLCRKKIVKFALAHKRLNMRLTKIASSHTTMIWAKKTHCEWTTSCSVNLRASCIIQRVVVCIKSLNRSIHWMPFLFRRPVLAARKLKRWAVSNWSTDHSKLAAPFVVDQNAAQRFQAQRAKETGDSIRRAW